MAPPSTVIPRTFTLVLPLRIVFLLIWLGALSISLYGWLVGSSSPLYVGLFFLVLLLNIWWIRTVRLEVSESGVSFQSGLYNRSLAWSDIESLSFQNRHYGTGGEMAMFVHSNNPSKESIKVNRFYFAGNKLRDFILTVMMKVPTLKLDPVIVRELEKYGAIKRTNAPA
jgi:hypothetical protein